MAGILHDDLVTVRELKRALAGTISRSVRWHDLQVAATTAGHRRGACRELKGHSQTLMQAVAEVARAAGLVALASPGKHLNVETRPTAVR